MNRKILFALWGGLFLLDACLGFVTAPTGVARGLMIGLSLLFFVPGGLLVWDAGKRGDHRIAALVRNLSALSLGTTALLLIANVFSALAGPVLGHALYDILVVVSSPMVCGQYWGISLFFWACLMIAAQKIQKKK